MNIFKILTISQLQEISGAVKVNPKFWELKETYDRNIPRKNSKAFEAYAKLAGEAQQSNQRITDRMIKRFIKTCLVCGADKNVQDLNKFDADSYECKAENDCADI